MTEIQLQTVPILGSWSPPAPRVPLETTVGLTFAKTDDYFVEKCYNISQSGIFIKTAEPSEPGSVVLFEIWLEEFFEIVQGAGEVVWTRKVAEGPQRPAGLGIRFLKLDGAGRDMIRRFVNGWLRQERDPFRAVRGIGLALAVSCLLWLFLLAAWWSL